MGTSPQKRHESLQNLSRLHHHALVIGQNLRRAGSSDVYSEEQVKEVVQKGARTLRRRASACAGHACSCTTYRTLRAHVQTSPNPCLHLTSTLFEQALKVDLEQSHSFAHTEHRKHNPTVQ